MSEKAIWEYLKTLKTGTDIQYMDIASGDFIVNDTGVEVVGNIFANAGSEVAVITFLQVKLKSQLASNASVKICDISDNGKALLGQTYISSMLGVKGNGQVVTLLFNTYENNSEITISNTTGAALAANTELSGTLTIMRT